MRELTARLLFLLACIATTLLNCESAPAGQQIFPVETSLSAEERRSLNVVKRRIGGYNAHDIDAFLAAHAEDVQIIEYPDTRIGEGRSHLEWIFGPQFERGLGKVDVVHQTAIGNTVISHERITIGDKVERLVAIYTVVDDVIASLRLIESVD